MPLSAARNTPMMGEGREFYAFTVAAGVTVYPGALVMLNASGLARPGAAATSQIAAGRAESGGTAGQQIEVRRGIFRWANSTAGDAITAAAWGQTVFIADDDRVALTNGSNTRSAAGICRGVDAAGVWVET